MDIIVNGGRVRLFRYFRYFNLYLNSIEQSIHGLACADPSVHRPVRHRVTQSPSYHGVAQAGKQHRLWPFGSVIVNGNCRQLQISIASRLLAVLFTGWRRQVTIAGLGETSSPSSTVSLATYTIALLLSSAPSGRPHAQRRRR